MRHFLIFLLFNLLFAGPVLNQDLREFIPRSPIAHPILFSGSFGELRSNHFHSGVDIKSSKWNTPGDPIFAIEDGYISRIKVQAGGYGNALYIDHPGGYTSVYGHLDSYSDSISQYVLKKQYEKESFGVDLYPIPGKFKVKKGDQIAKMGNSGRSFAAHLHFEIRHTESELPINPIIFGIGPKDNRAPTISNINLVHLLQDTNIVDRERISPQFIRNGLYRLKKDTLEIGAWRIGVEVNGFDRMDGSSNKNGIYELKLNLDGQKVYHYKLDSFSFDESEHINAHINYMDFNEMKRRYQRCYQLPGDPLSIYLKDSLDTPVIALFRDKIQHIEVLAYDIAGNVSKLEFWVRRAKEMSPPPPILHNYLLKSNESHLITRDDYILFFPDSSLYQNCYLNLDENENIEAPLASKQLFIHANNIFKHKVDLYINASHIPDSLLEKTCIVQCGGSSLISYGGLLFEDHINTKIRKFGSYALYIDTLAPSITPIRFSGNARKMSYFSFKIEDNLEIGGNARGLRFNGYIDGKWVLFKHDAKSSLITCDLDKKLSSGEHTLKIELTDDRNNSSIFEKKFYR